MFAQLPPPENFTVHVMETRTGTTRLESVRSYPLGVRTLDVADDVNVVEIVHRLLRDAGMNPQHDIDGGKLSIVTVSPTLVVDHMTATIKFNKTCTLFSTVDEHVTIASLVHGEAFTRDVCPVDKLHVYVAPFEHYRCLVAFPEALLVPEFLAKLHLKLGRDNALSLVQLTVHDGKGWGKSQPKLRSGKFELLFGRSLDTRRGTPPTPDHPKKRKAEDIPSPFHQDGSLDMLDILVPWCVKEKVMRKFRHLVDSMPPRRVKRLLDGLVVDSVDGHEAVSEWFDETVRALEDAEDAE